jgi:hypothetical protein
MPLTEEDEIFVEKCVQRSVIVSGGKHCGRASTDHEDYIPSPLTGVEQAHLLQWDPHCRLAEDGGDMSRGT